MSEPPANDVHYWLQKTDEAYPTNLYPQGPPLTTRKSNPNLDFAVYTPICGRTYFLSLLECTAAANAVVDAFAKASSSNFFTATPPGCVELGAVALVAGEPAHTIEPQTP